MLRTTLPLVAAAGLLIPTLARAQDGLEIGTVRFYRADGNQTMVKAFVAVPYSIAQPAGGGITYRVSMKVADQAGLKLADQTWTKHVPAEQVVPGASGLEVAEFATVPGKYRLDVTVEDSVSGRKAQAGTDITGFAAVPDASDLLLTPAMRPATDSDTVPSPGWLRRGSVMLVPVAKLRLHPPMDTASKAMAYYLMEVYNPTQNEMPATVEVAILDSAGGSVVKAPGNPVRIGAGGGILKGGLDLTGLPTGNYTFQVTATAGGKAVTRSAPFSMAPARHLLALTTSAATVGTDNTGGVPSANVVSGGAGLTDEAYFATMSEAALDSAFAPLLYIAKGGELKPYSKGLSVTGKRNFLVQFWKKRDPTPGNDGNEERTRFYDAIAFANRSYGERGRASVVGWRTDRGRVFAKNGAPDDVFQRPAEGRAPPYIVWRITRGRPRYYIFADRTGIGNYSLIQTNDRNEFGMQGWRELLGTPAVQEIGRYLGIDFFSDTNDSPN